MKANILSFFKKTFEGAKTKKGILAITAILFFSIDFFSKSLVKNWFENEKFNPSEDNFIIKNFLRLTYEKNSGISFGFLSGNSFVVTFLVFLLILFFGIFVFKNKNYEASPIGFGLIIGGSLGNFLDRVLYKGFVLDFLEVKNFSVLNLADVFISCGFLIVILNYAKIEKQNNSQKTIRKSRRITR